MEPLLELQDYTRQLLSQAIDGFLRLAYPQGQPSEAVRQRASLPEGLEAEALLADERFERSNQHSCPTPFLAGHGIEADMAVYGVHVGVTWRPKHGGVTSCGAAVSVTGEVSLGEVGFGLDNAADRDTGF